MNKNTPYLYLCRRLVLCLGIALFCANGVWAQTGTNGRTEDPCQKLLDTLQSDFRNGNLRSLLIKAKADEDCVAGFSSGDKAKYYAIMARAELFLGQKTTADSLTVELLKVDPYYEADSSDADLFYLLHQFNTHPLISLGVNTGLNFSQVNILQDYSLGGSGDSKESYKSAVNYRLGLGVQIPLPLFQYKLSISTGILLNALSYQYANTLRTATIGGAPLDYSNISFRENQMWLRVPVLAHYEFEIPYNKNKEKDKHKQLSFYAELGVGADFLLDAKLRKLKRTTLGSETSLSAEVTNLQTINSPLRTINHLSCIGGVGVHREIGKFRASFGLQYSYLFGNMVRSENRYRDNSLIYQYNHIDDDFNIGGISVCLSVQYHFFSQKRKKENSIAENVIEKGAREQLDKLGDAVGGDLKKDIEAEKKALEADKKALEDKMNGKKDELYDKVKARKEKAKAKLKSKISKPWD